MKKVLVIVGPTSVGKSDLSIRIAQSLPSEIISGDSIQVYRQLTIGSAKITAEEMKGVTHHCIDTLDYNESYSVYDFQTQARNAIDTITLSGKLPIIVGGTGFYIKATLYDYTFENEEKIVIDELTEETSEELYQKLNEIDPQTAQKIHLNNRKRLIRALTIASHGKLKSEIENAQTHQPLYDIYMVVLDVNREILHQRIEQRVDRMLANGLLEEVKTYFSDQESWTYQSFQGIGYKEWMPYLLGTQSIQEVRQAIIVHTRQFAKRQYTWFRHQFTANWVDSSDEKAINMILEEIKDWSNQPKGEL